MSEENENPKKKRLTKLNVKQKMFARELLKPGMTQTQAYMNVYGTESAKNASVMAAQTVARPYVAQHIADLIDDQYPEAAKDCTDTLRDIIRNPESTNGEKMKAIELLAKFKAWNAPTKHLNLSAKIDAASKYKLPGGEE